MPSLHHSLPWTTTPLIINAPMGSFAGPALATAVSRAHGLGLIGSLNDMTVLDTQLSSVASALPRTDEGLLPIGVGLLLFITKLDEALPVLRKWKPSVVWMFAAQRLDEYGVWAERVRAEVPGTAVWVQVGNVGAAVEVAREARPDALCVQGSDAGGHGFEKGAGVVSLLPEVADTLAAEGLDVPLVASGGIVDGRGVAAALALGARGVVLGTRFLAAEETTIHPRYREALLQATDGGQATIRSKLFDNLRGPNVWPTAYDGRSLVMRSYEEHLAGAEMEAIRTRHNEAVKGEDAGFAVGGEGRAAMWAGTGVGMVKKVQPAGEIVDEVRAGARRVLEGVGARL